MAGHGALARGEAHDLAAGLAYAGIVIGDKQGGVTFQVLVGPFCDRRELLEQSRNLVPGTAQTLLVFLHIARDLARREEAGQGETD